MLQKRFPGVIAFTLLNASLFATEITNRTFYIAWDDRSENESGFCIECKHVSETRWTILDSTAANQNVYGPIILNEEDICQIRVYAFNEYGNSACSNTLTVSVEGTFEPVQLSWPSFSENDQYNIYYNTYPFSNPDEDSLLAQSVRDTDALTPGIQWTDFSHGPEDTLHNHYYTITEDCKLSLADSFYRIGSLSYNLKRIGNLGINHLALPVCLPDASNAGTIMNLIPNAESIASWSPDIQQYSYYNPANPSTNFKLHAGSTFIVNVMSGDIWSVTGEIIPTKYNLITTNLTNFNEIMMPMQTGNISSASQLMGEIPWCNSVAFWDPAIQSYSQYIPNVPDSDFPVYSGQPYFIHVTRPVVWPSDSQPALSKISGATPIVDHVPHTVIGPIDTALKQKVILEAFISSRPDEKLDTREPAIQILDQYWMIQCAVFRTSWKIGDRLIIRASLRSGERIELSVPLTVNPFDICDETIQFSGNTPNKSGLLQCYPNPFNETVTIPYNIAQENHVTISIINILGEKVVTLVNQVQTQGYHEISWNGRDNSNQYVASNLYFVLFKDKTMTHKEKLILLQ